MTPLQQQFEALRAEFPGATMEPLPSGAALVSIPDFPLPSGWLQSRTTVKFLAPVGYPLAKPDSFWASPDLRLQNGAMPQSTNQSGIPEVNGSPQLMFSWHLSQWNPNRDALLTYLRVIEQRLRQAQ
jgi:hypothetical protein